MKIILIFMALLFCLSIPNEIHAKKRKKNKKAESETPVPPTSYEKLFKGKKYTTKEGVFKTHLFDDNKVFVEFPADYLNRSMLLSSSIEEISDNGEGVVGQFAGRSLHFKFVRKDSTLQARLLFTSEPINTQNDKNIDRAINKIENGGIYKLFKILATAPNGGLVVDMTSLFLEHSAYTNPFSAYALNSFYGLMGRLHTYRPELGSIRDFSVDENTLSVQCRMGYYVNTTAMGQTGNDNKEVSILTNKMLTLLPLEDMKPRIADSRIGINFIRRNNFSDERLIVEPVFYTAKWKIEPVDENAHKKGEIVDVKKPIIFYLDPITPNHFKNYIREGVLEWNKAFEQIGFKNVLRVETFPENDSEFDPHNIKYSTIRFSPLPMKEFQQSFHYHPGTGEILNTSLYIHSGLMDSYFTDYTSRMLATDKRITQVGLPDDVIGELLRADVMRAVGYSLGLRNNYASSSVYDVDSLRSATFTQQYGITPSIMDGINYNYVARRQDADKGVILIPNKIGEYDYFAIKWLYSPMYDVTPIDEIAILNEWTENAIKKNHYRFKPEQYTFYDPSVMNGNLGNDPVKTLQYTIENMKQFVAQVDDRLRDTDKRTEERNTMKRFITFNLNRRIRDASINIGGFYFTNDGSERYQLVPKKKQKETVIALLNLLKDVEWMDSNNDNGEYDIRDSDADKTFSNVIFAINSRLEFLALNAQKSKDTYTVEEMTNDIYNFIFSNTLKSGKLGKEEMKLQKSFVNNILSLSTVSKPASDLNISYKSILATRNLQTILPERYMIYNDKDWSSTPSNLAAPYYSGFYAPDKIDVLPEQNSHFYYSMLLKIRDLMNQAVANSSGENRVHYDYLRFKINQALNK